MAWQTKRIETRDPYSKGGKGKTDLYRFAEREGVRVMTVYHWWRRHGESLAGFRERREKNRQYDYEVNGEKRKGTIKEIASALGAKEGSLRSWIHAHGGKVNGYDPKRRRGRGKRKIAFPDGHEEYLIDYADRMGVNRNTVAMYIRYHGSIAGFEIRGAKGGKAVEYTDSENGESRTAREWAEHYKTSKGAVKQWAKKHGGDMRGYGEAMRKSVEISWNGKRKTMREWSKEFGVTYGRAYMWWKKHGASFKGFKEFIERKRKAKEVA